MIQPERQPTRLALGEVDLAQPIDQTSPLTEGLEGLWVPLPHLSGGERLYDLSTNGRHGDLTNMDPSTDWVYDSEVPFAGLDFASSPDRSVIIGRSEEATTLQLGAVDQFSVFIMCEWTGKNGDFNSAIDTYEDVGTHRFSLESKISDDSSTIAWKTDSDSLDAGVDLSSDLNAIQYLGFSYDHASGTVRSVLNGQQYSTMSTSGQAQLDDLDLSFAGRDPTDFNTSLSGRIYGVVFVVGAAWTQSEHATLYDQARRGFPDLLNRRDESQLYVSTSGAVTEAATLTAQASLQATDAALGDESSALSTTATPTAADTATATEQAGLSSTATPNATETATAIEQAALNSTATLNASETATITEAVSLAATATLSVTETVGNAVTEAATLAVSASLSSTETASSEESAQVSSQVSLAAQEAATATEALRLETEGRLDAQEAVTVTEAAQIQVEAALDLIEEATATEAAKIGAVATWSVTETTGNLITGRISEVGRNAVQPLSRPFNNAE